MRKPVPPVKDSPNPIGIYPPPRVPRKAAVPPAKKKGGK